MRNVFIRHGKLIALVVGFLFSAMGAQSRNHVPGVLTAIVGSAVLLAANVITQRSPRRDGEPSQPHG